MPGLWGKKRQEKEINTANIIEKREMREGIKAMLSSKKMDWTTPQDFFEELDREFNFTLDPCASAENAKCKKFYTEEDDGLTQSWDNEIVFCNPPYGREMGKWVKKASEAVGGVVVMLIPARTDTRYFHDYIYHKAEIRFIRGRLKFGGEQRGSGSAPFPSMVVVFRVNEKIERQHEEVRQQEQEEMARYREAEEERIQSGLEGIY